MNLINNNENMNLITLAIFLFISFAEIQAKKSKCNFGLFKTTEVEFIECSLKASFPVTFCLDCVEKYQNLVAVYETLKNNETCKNMYIDNARLNIVPLITDNLISLFDKGYCLDCFGEDFKVNDEIKTIKTQIETVNSCINENTKIACEQCSLKYRELNIFYDQIKTKHKNKICFDIEDSMNKTRILWSKTLQCCDRTANLGAFAALSSVFAILPIFFYCSFVIWGRRSERNHAMLNPDPENQPSTSSAIIDHTINNILEASRNLTQNGESININSNSKEQSDSDDDSLLSNVGKNANGSINSTEKNENNSKERKEEIQPSTSNVMIEQTINDILGASSSNRTQEGESINIPKNSKKQDQNDSSDDESLLRNDGKDKNAPTIGTEKNAPTIGSEKNKDMMEF